MSRLPIRRPGALLIALVLLILGLAGAVSYAQDYNVHRGFATVVPFRRAGTGRLEDVHFYSRALHGEADYLVYLPPHYSAAHRYPVYYLLHGSPGQPHVFVDIANLDVRLDNQISLGRSRPMILVFPDGRIDGDTFSDSEWANTPSGDYMSYVINVVHDVDHRFAAIAERDDRVIGGFSAGAFGAMNIALHNLNTFADVQSWSGYFTETHNGVFAHASPAVMAANSPVDYVRRIHVELRRDPLRAYLFVGRDDGSEPQQAPMVRQLEAAGVRVGSAIYPGGHDWGVWWPRLDQMLDMASFDMAHPPTWRDPARLASLRQPSLPPARVRPAVAPGRPVGPRHHHSSTRLVASLLLALIASALINFGFVLQHRGHERARELGTTGRLGPFQQPAWLLGQLTGWTGFAGSIVAVALAPLTLVQAFSAGSLALSVPLAAAALGHRVTRRQALAIALIGVSLATLPIGFGGTHGAHQYGLLILAAILVLAVDGVLRGRGGATPMALLAGAFYGVADAAIKAEALALRFHGASIFTGWTLLALLCTFGGFLAFQAALSAGDAVRPLSLMNACTAVAAMALGVLAFGERLGSSAPLTVLHLIAIAVVLGCASTLVESHEGAPQTPPAAPAPAPNSPMRTPAPSQVRSAISWVLEFGRAAAAVIAACLTTIGLLYGLRGLNIFSAGPHIPDSLPLLQLAGYASQPLLRVTVASLLGGVVVGVVLAGSDLRRRVPLIGMGALGLLLLASDASSALALNVPLSPVMLHSAAGFGPWLEAALLTAGSSLPGISRQIHLPASLRGTTRRRILAPGLAGLLTITVAAALIPAAGSASSLPLMSAAAQLEGTAAGSAVTPTPAPRPHRHPRTNPRLLAAGHRLRRPMVGRVRSQPATLTSTLDATLASARVQLHAPGATAALMVCGRVVWQDAVGVADEATQQPVTGNSLFILNSAVKTIVATMIMQEVDAHRLSLSEKVSRFYPFLPDADEITVRMLLNMTSGLPEYLETNPIKSVVAKDPRYPWTRREILTGLGSGLGSIDFTPGSQYQYSDTNYIVLGGILTQVTHATIQHDFEVLIARPLGLTDASWDRTPAAMSALVHAYSITKTGALHDDWLPGFGPGTVVWGPVFTDGGLAASSVDLARFANALLSGRLVPEADVAEMIRLGVKSGYGFGIRGKWFDDQFWLGHGGAYQGYDAEDWTNLPHELTWAVSTNGEGGSDGLLSNLVWQNLVVAESRLDPSLPSCGAEASPSLRRDRAI